MMAYMFTEVVHRLNSKYSSVIKAIPKFPIKPQYFTDITSKTMCYPFLTSFSTLDQSTEVIANDVKSNKIGSFYTLFPPYKCSTRTKECKFKGYKYSGKNSMDHKYYKGWMFGQDRPGIKNKICQII
jgi:hypothetical protein